MLNPWSKSRYPHAGQRATGYTMNRRMTSRPTRRGTFNYLERKQINRSIALTPLAAGAVVLLNRVAVGTNDNQRIGNQVMLKTLQIHVEIRALAASFTQRMRIALVYDRQPNGALTTIGSIFDTNNPRGFMNLNRRLRYKILWNSGLFTMGQFNSGNTIDTTAFEVYIKTDLPVQYSGTGDDIDDITTGAVLFVVQAEAILGINSHEIEADIRLRYTDGRTTGREYAGRPKLKGGHGVINR